MPDNDLLKELDEIVTDFYKSTRKLAETIVADGVSRLLESLPYVTGRYLRSIKYIISQKGPEGQYVIEIFSDPSHFGRTYYPPFVEYGTKPHKVPLKALITWAQLKFGLPEEEAIDFAGYVQKKIEREGTEGQYQFRDTFEYLSEKYVSSKIIILMEAFRK